MKIVLAAAATALAVVSAPTASADTVSYLDFLTDHDLVIKNASDAIDVGYGVYNAIDGGYSPEEVGMWLYGNISWADMEDAATIVVASIYHLCPGFTYMLPSSNNTARTKEKGMVV